MTDPDTSTAAPEPEPGEMPTGCIDPLHVGDVPPDIDATDFSEVLEFIGTGPAHFHVTWTRVEEVNGSPFPGWRYYLTLHLSSIDMGTVPDLSALDDPATTQAEIWDMQRRGQASELRELAQALVGGAALIFGTADRIHPSLSYRTQVVKGPGPEADAAPVDGQHDLPDDYPTWGPVDEEAKARHVAGTCGGIEHCARCRLANMGTSE